MIKRIIFLTLLLFPILVLANEKDEFYIEELDYKFRIYSKNKYEVEENFKTKLQYGYKPDTYYFIRNIKKIYIYNYNNKKYEYENNIELIDFTDKYFAFDDESGLSASFGHEGILLYEEENFNLKYEINLKNKNDELFSYYIGSTDYKIKNTKFQIILPYLINENIEILFSIDGKNFKKEIDGIKYNIDLNQAIVGEYNKTLNKNQNIYFLIFDKNTLNQDVPSKSIIDYLYLIAIILIFIVLSIYFIKRKKSRK